MKWERRNRKIAIFLIAPASLLIIFGLAYPLYYNITQSFSNTGLANLNVKHNIGFNNYINVFSDNDFWGIAKNTAIWSFGLTIAIILLSLVMAIMLNKKIKGRTVYRVFALLPWVIPGVVAGLIWQYLVHPMFGPINDILWKTGVINEYVPWLGQISTSMLTVMIVYLWKVFPMPMVMFLATLQTVPDELYEAARVDGASRWQTTKLIILPMIKNVIMTTSILMFITAFNSFDLIYVMTRGGPLHSSETLAMYIYNIAFSEFRYEKAATVSIIMFAFAISIVFIYIKRMNKKEENIL